LTKKKQATVFNGNLLYSSLYLYSIDCSVNRGQLYAVYAAPKYQHLRCACWVLMWALVRYLHLKF